VVLLSGTRFEVTSGDERSRGLSIAGKIREGYDLAVQVLGLGPFPNPGRKRKKNKTVCLAF
jgi:hypothetical protein